MVCPCLVSCFLRHLATIFQIPEISHRTETRNLELWTLVSVQKLMTCLSWIILNCTQQASHKNRLCRLARGTSCFFLETLGAEKIGHLCYWSYPSYPWAKGWRAFRDIQKCDMLIYNHLLYIVCLISLLVAKQSPWIPVLFFGVSRARTQYPGSIKLSPSVADFWCSPLPPISNNPQ